MSNSKPGNIVKQIICYIGGLFIITIGINISKMSNLCLFGISTAYYSSKEL